MLFMGLLHHYYKMNMFSNIIVLVSSTPFQTYNITSCDHGHMPLHHPRKDKRRKRKSKEKKY